MKKELRFIHNGNQCPWIEYAEQNARNTALKNGYDFTKIDASMNLLPAISLFTPFSIYLDNRYITSSPLPADKINEIITKQEELKFLDRQDTSLPSGKLNKIVPLDEKTILDQCRICMNGQSSASPENNWFKRNQDDIIGCVGYSDDIPVVFIESLPEELIPYTGLGSDASVIGITCLYNNAESDYRQEIMEWFISHLKRNSSYKKLRILSGEYSFYPNGTLAFFEECGFKIVKRIGEIPLYGIGKDSVFLLEIQL